MDFFLKFMFRVRYAFLSVHCSRVVNAEKALTSWLSCICSFFLLCHFPMCFPGSDVVLDCIDTDICLLTYFV